MTADERQRSTAPTGSSASPPGAIAVVAGSGQLPIEAVEALRHGGRGVCVIAFEGLSDPLVGGAAPDVAWIPFGQLEPLARALDERHNPAVLLLGKFDKARLDPERAADVASSRVPFSPDAVVSAALAVNPKRRDDHLLAQVVDWFEARGTILLDQAQALPSFVVADEVLTIAQPSAAALADLALAIEILHDREACGDAQCVIVRDRKVLAIEDDAGTDAAIRRAAASGDSGAKGATVVKLTRPGQDRRIDLPTCGPETMRQLAASGATHLALEAGASLIVSRAAVLAAANDQGVSIWGVPSPWRAP